jgi:hypothetical protein
MERKGERRSLMGATTMREKAREREGDNNHPDPGLQDYKGIASVVGVEFPLIIT